MAGSASIVGAAETNVGKVRDHNEDAHFIDPDAGIFLVCDGMGGHAAGEVASNLAVSVIREKWSSDELQDVAAKWLENGTPDARKQMIAAIQNSVVAAHDAILAEAERDKTKGGMGTTLVGAIVVGGDIVFAHCGDSRAYIVRDGIAMQLTEDHTLLARLLAAGVDVDAEGEGSRFKSMLTNALGIGAECKVSTFVVPVADGDRFLLCSDGITEYVKEAEIGEVLTKQPSPARSAQRLIEMALDRGGGDNATALVVRVLEAGETSRPAELLRREDEAIHACPLWARTTPQQRLRALRIALPREHAAGEKIPAQTLGDRVAWILIEGQVDENGTTHGPGSLLYPEALLADRPLPDKDGLARAIGEVRALALRSDDFREICEEDPDLAERLLEGLAAEIAARRPQRRTGKIIVQFDADARGTTDPGITARKLTDPSDPARAATDPTAATTAESAAEQSAPAPERSTLIGTGLMPIAAATPAESPAPPPRTTIIGTGPTRPASTTTPPTSAATLPKVPSGPHPRVPAPARTPTPARGVPTGRTVTPAGGQALFGSSLRVPKGERADADAALDSALRKITVEEPWGEARKRPSDPPPIGSISPEADDTAGRAETADGEPETIIVVEADEPAETQRPVAARPAARSRALSEPEISIETLVEMDADVPEPGQQMAGDDAEIVIERAAPLPAAIAPVIPTRAASDPNVIEFISDEPSSPEIEIIRASESEADDDDDVAVAPPAPAAAAGSTAPERPTVNELPRRAKRQTDAPD